MFDSVENTLLQCMSGYQWDNMYTAQSWSEQPIRLKQYSYFAVTPESKI